MREGVSVYFNTLFLKYSPWIHTLYSACLFAQQKSIDKLRSLEIENVELKVENQRLRQMLGMKAISDAGSPLSPPISNSGSPMPQIMSDPTTQLNNSEPLITPKIETDHKVVFIQRGLSPHSKFALCIFMFAVVSLNSFGSLILNDQRPNVDLADENYNMETARRAILSTMIDDVSDEL